MAGSQSSLREANRSAVVETVKRHGGLTQVELVGATGLSPATVSTIVKQLVSDGVVEVRTTIRTGRRAQLVTLAHRVGLAVGVHVGHRHIRVAIADFTHEVLAERVLPMPVDHPVDTSLDRTALLVVDLLERLGLAMQDVVGIGIGLPAPVDDATGMISVRGIMRGWDEVHVGHVLSKRLALPVYVDNDANLGALAESTRGASREYRDSVYVRASYGTGAGIVINHQLHRGFAGTAGEIGHVQVDPQGDICRCGSRGCLDTVVGARAIVEPLRATHGNLTLRDVVQRARDGDPGCAQVIADAGAEIGAVVSGVAMTVNPQCIVVGGELAETGEILLQPMREALRRRVLLNQIAPLEVIPAELGNAAEVAGAIALVMQHADVDLDPPLTAPERADA
ncbi:ROK family transcriptional regulator [Cellulomonas fimi]|uniref:ROK family transcriptional regulator n=1 Tax=Cellulomonas fimi TaxID=1708 RepID=UPI00234D9BE6|nr:ROK family transcriptional regulator [Cellulomonas fimi]MDC7122283.1 ROK family transcriptional regulator [Cellulomonas fimi]